jgi:hypothetical protein
VTAALAVVLALASPNDSGWEKLFEVPPGPAWLSSVWADDRGWFAAGKALLVRSSAAGVVSESRPGRTVLGLSASRRGLLALGSPRLVLRFDGQRWVEEHFATLPAKAGRRIRYDAVLHTARAMGGDGPLIAYGPHAVLVAQPDGTWVAPPEPERARLSLHAQLFRAHEPPAGCAPALWLWWAGARGWLSCHGGQSFVIDGDQARATGVLPRTCNDGGDAAAERGSEVYLLCRGQLWRSVQGRWTPVAAPRDLLSVAATGRCVYVAGNRAVWRRCDVAQR